MTRYRAILLAFLAAQTFGLPAQACQPRTLSAVQAKRILDHMVYRDDDGSVRTVIYSPYEPKDPKPEYYAFAAQKSKILTDRDAIDNGLTGYYEVDKITGDVIDTVSFERVKQKALSRYIAKVRAETCITAALVYKRRRVSPF